MPLDAVTPVSPMIGATLAVTSTPAITLKTRKPASAPIPDRARANLEGLDRAIGC